MIDPSILCWMEINRGNSVFISLETIKLSKLSGQGDKNNSGNDRI